MFKLCRTQSSTGLANSLEKQEFEYQLNRNSGFSCTA